MTESTLPPCPTPCDPDCEAECHESHVPDHGDKRTHQPWACKGIREAILATATAIAQSLADPAAVEAMEEVSRKVMLAGVNEIADEVMSQHLRELEAAIRTAERKRIITLARKLGATYPVEIPPEPGSEGSTRHAWFPFGDYLQDVPAERQGEQAGG